MSMEIEDDEQTPSAGPTTNLAVALGVIALGAAVLAGAIALGPGTPAEPDSGTWPLLIGLLLTALGVALALRFRQEQDAEVFTRNSGLVLAGLGTMVVFVAAIETVGFELPSLALMAVWLRFFGHESLRSTALISVLATAGLYLIFVAALDVPIPHLL
jgi:hypothetical protein